MARKKNNKNSEELEAQEYSPFEDPIYSRGMQELISKFLKKGANITNTLNGDITVTETRIYQTVYGWDREKRKIIIKSKGIVN